MSIGQILALFGAAIAVVLAGMGSSKGVGLSGETAAGVSTENPEVNSKLLVLQLLPATQGIYGFLVAVIVLIKTGVLGGAMLPVTGGAGPGDYRGLPACRRRRLLLRNPSGQGCRRQHDHDRPAPRYER